MHSLRPAAAFTITLLLSGAAHGEHSHLLPSPVQITYGQGSVPVKRLCVSSLRASAANEDRFSRSQLIAAGIHPCAAEGINISLVRTGTSDALPQPGEITGPYSREAYTISVKLAGIRIQSKSTAGVFYGVETLLQMIERAPSGEEMLPFAEVSDYPALAYRAILMDAGSEGPMLKLSEVKAQLDFLARWKGNQYFFYSEGNIELKGYPLLNPHARFTQADIREIVAYARERHIDVVPAVEMYGHLHDLFRIEKYSNLADSPHGVEFDPNAPGVAPLVEAWAAQINDLFPSRFVDIGFDETWALSRATEHAGPGSQPYELFLKQLNLVSSQFTARGKTVLAWADIMVKFPGIVSRLPRQIVALPWWYEPEPDPTYKSWVDPLVAEKIPYIATSGVHSWNEIAPDFSMSFRNIDTWIVAGKRSGSLGLLNTLWTDNGQMLMRMSWPGIAYGAAAAWQSEPMKPESFFSDYSRIQYAPDVATHMSQALRSLNQAEGALQQALGQRTMQEFWSDPFTMASLKHMSTHREALRDARLHAEDAMEDLLAVQSMAPNTPHLESLAYGVQNIDLAGMKFLYAGEIADTWASLPKTPAREVLMGSIGQSISNEAHSRAMDMMDGISETQRIYRHAWEQQYTSYRLETAMSRWAAELEYWRQAQANLEVVRMNFRTGDTLPPIEEVIHRNGH